MIRAGLITSLSCPQNCSNSPFPVELNENSSPQHSVPWCYPSLSFHPCLHPKTLKEQSYLLSSKYVLCAFPPQSLCSYIFISLKCYPAYLIKDYFPLFMSSPKAVTFLEPIGIPYLFLPPFIYSLPSQFPPPPFKIFIGLLKFSLTLQYLCVSVSLLDL